MDDMRRIDIRQQRCIKFYYRERSVWKLAFVISALCAMYIVISAFLAGGKVHSRKMFGEEKV